jgi:PAS domain S-box-containing protein
MLCELQHNAQGRALSAQGARLVPRPAADASAGAHGHGAAYAAPALLTEAAQPLADIFRVAFESAPNGILVIDEESRITIANSHAVRMFGYTDADDMVGMLVDTLIPPQLRGGHMEYRRTYMAAPSVRPMGAGREVFALRRDGSEFPVEVGLNPVQTAIGRRVLCVIIDITERRRLEDRTRRMVEAAPMGVILIGSDGHIMSVNQSVERLCGYSRSELVGRAADILVPERLRGDVVAPPSGTPVAATYFAATRPMCVVLCKDGSEVPVDIHATQLHTVEGTQLLAYVVDVTERVHAEALQRAVAAAEAAVRGRGDFLARTSHELRTPLNGVVGMAALLADTPLSTEQAALVDTIQCSADHVLSIIADILDYSKIEAGCLAIEHLPFAPRRVVDDAAAALGRQARAKGLAFVVNVDDSVPAEAIGDAGRIRQVLVNLISNAVKFTERGSIAVTVRCESPPTSGGSLVLAHAVQDTGIGIPADVQARLFRPFAQADSSMARRFGGSGLGLAISQSLAQLMDGSVNVESERGIGSTFTFRACLDVVHGPQLNACRGARVLVATARADVRDELCSLLRSAGADVVPVIDAPSAIATLQRAEAAGCACTAALVDADIASAFSAAAEQHLATLHAKSRPAVIVLVDDMRITVRRPADADVLVLPTDASALASCVERALHHRTARLAVCVSPTAASRQLRGHLLVAEDDEVSRRLARAMLVKLGCTCDCVADGRQAVDSWQRGHYDAVLMDCEMPNVDGVAATAEIRRREAAAGSAARIPIVAMTANAMVGDRDRCVAAGMDGYVAKPVRMPALVAALARCLPAEPAEPAEPAAL